MMNTPKTPYKPYVLGLSGGPDSVYLLHWLLNTKELQPNQIIAAHLDHQWRADSDLDVHFCKQLCTQLNVLFMSARMSELNWTKPKRGSKEEIGRSARRYFLESVMHAHGAQGIYLGHHLDDQQETFLLRIIRGASLTGLTCMKEQAGIYLRPLLNLKKTAIVAHLEAHNITYLTDPSNASDNFLRNRIRNHALPALRAADQRFDDNFALTLTRLQQTETLINSMTEKVWITIAHQAEGKLYIAVDPLLACEQALLERLLLKWFVALQVPFAPSTAFFAEVIRFLKRPGKRQHQIHTEWSIEKTKTYAHIVKMM